MNNRAADIREESLLKIQEKISAARKEKNRKEIQTIGQAREWLGDVLEEREYSRFTHTYLKGEKYY